MGGARPPVQGRVRGARRKPVPVHGRHRRLHLPRGHDAQVPLAQRGGRMPEQRGDGGVDAVPLGPVLVARGREVHDGLHGDARVPHERLGLREGQDCKRVPGQAAHKRQVLREGQGFREVLSACGGRGAPRREAQRMRRAPCEEGEEDHRAGGEAHNEDGHGGHGVQRVRGALRRPEGEAGLRDQRVQAHGPVPAEAHEEVPAVPRRRRAVRMRQRLAHLRGIRVEVHHDLQGSSAATAMPGSCSGRTAARGTGR